MPRSSERELYDPVAGDAREQWRAVHWGRRPRRAGVAVDYVGEVKQRLVEMGKLVHFAFADGRALVVARPYPSLAFGEVDQRLYVVGGSTAAMARAGRWGAPGFRRECAQVYYRARKGVGARVELYFHDFEDELPVYRVGDDGWPRVEGGSYFVAPEGIVG